MLMKYILILWSSAYAGHTYHIEFNNKEACENALVQMKETAGAARPWAICVEKGRL